MLSSNSAFGHIYCCKKGREVYIKTSIANSVDPTETTHYVPPRQDVHCLKKKSFCLGLQGWKIKMTAP